MEAKRDYYGEMRSTYENAMRETSGEGKKVVFSVCPETYQKQCKLCEACKSVLWHKDNHTEDMVKKAGELNRKERFYANVLLSTNPNEVVVFEYGPTIGNKLVSYEMGVDSDYKGFSDPDRGRNIVIVKYPNVDPKKTKYDVEARVNSTPIDRKILGNMHDLDLVIEEIRSGKVKALYQSKLPAGKTEMRFLPSWLGPQFSSIFQLKYKLHYHTSEEELVAIQKGELNPLEDIIIVKPEQGKTHDFTETYEIKSGPTSVNPWGVVKEQPTAEIPSTQWPTTPVVAQTQALSQAGRLACFGTYDEAEPECTMTCAKTPQMAECKSEWEKKVAQRKAAKGLYR